MSENVTSAAMRAANLIDDIMTCTGRDPSTIEGMALAIDGQTFLPELLSASRELVEQVERDYAVSPGASMLAGRLRKVIEQAGSPSTVVIPQ